MKIIPAIWLMFAIIFGSFSAYHFAQLNSSFPRFAWLTPSARPPEFLSGTAEEAKSNLQAFINQWNTYIDRQNELNYCRSLIAFIGYLISCIMAVIATLLPGPYNIRDTATYLHEHCTKSRIHEIFIRHVKTFKKKHNEDKKKKANNPD